MRVRIASLGFLGAGLVATLGCPAEVKDTSPAPAPKAQPQVDESDPRVVKIGDDLYAADALPQTSVEDIKGKGSGKPDESNGFCRLYAPKLPEPHCCLNEAGFDAEAAAKSCGKPLYLGESFQRSCGYYFHDGESGKPVWFRASFVDAPSPKEAADTEANRLKLRFGADIEVKQMKNTPGAYTLTYSGISYAWVAGDPAWPNVRRLAWNESTCTPEGLEAVVSQMATAKAPPKGAKRQGLVPKAR
ncbi:MAG: hypothetical protein ACRBN8_00155 [Nannocystales bacterium]